MQTAISFFKILRTWRRALSTPPRTPSGSRLSWECRMLACRPEVQNDRHETSGLTCRRHVGQHVTDIVQTRVGEGINMTHPNVGFCDMSANVSKKSTLSTIFNILESISTQQSNIAMRRCCWGMATAWGHLGRRVGQPLKVAVAAEDQRQGG